MQVAIAKGEIEFDAAYTANDTYVKQEGESKGTKTSMLEIDPTVPPGFISLKTKLVGIKANNLKVKKQGDIRLLGWANVIIDSQRHFHYSNGLVTTDTIGQLPTWDGEEGHRWPFYLDAFVSIDESPKTKEKGCSDWHKVGEEFDLPFNDAPSMAPSFEPTACADGIPMGKFILSPHDKKIPMTSISGQDTYLACLTVIDKKKKFHVAWAVSWTVKFAASVMADAKGEPIVTLHPTSIVSVALKHSHNGAALLATTLGRTASAAQKVFRTNGVAL